jgi:glucoamylase
LLHQANYLISKGNTSYPTSDIWPKVQIDLDYVAGVWNDTGFDLWEEIEGSSFFTIAAQHRAMRQGAAFATKQGDSARASTYAAAANALLCFLQVRKQLPQVCALTCIFIPVILVPFLFCPHR